MKKLLLSIFSVMALNASVNAQCATSSAPTNNCTFGDFINTFAMGGVASIGNAGCSGGSGYISYATPVRTLQIGATISWSATTGPSYAQGIGVWIDLNNDGSYANSEFVTSSPSLLTHNGSFVMPTGVTGTNLRMRVRCAYATSVNNTDACINNIGSYGETEDYFVFLTPSGPPNDLCTNASSIAVVGTYTGTTLGATLENPAPPSCITTLSQPGVWYTLTGNGNKLGVDLTCASSWDSKVFVYTGACGAFTCVTGNDDVGPICPSSAAASVTWCSVPGTQYRILVTGYSSASNFTLNTTQTVIATPTITASQNPVCAGNTTTLTGTGNTTYSWNPSASTAASVAVTPTATTIYTVTGTAGGCAAPAAFLTLAVNATPTVVVAGGAICSGNSFTLSPSGATSYTYSSGPVVTPIANASYTVTGTTAGCSSSAVASVTVNATPTVVVAGGAICAGNSFTLNPSGATSYTYSSGPVVTPIANASYTVTGTTAGCSSSAVASVTVNATPTVVVAGGAICAGNSFTLSPSGATSYTYSSGPVVTPTANASYTVTGSAANGCSSNAVASVTVNANPTVTAVSSLSLICNGQTASLTASGASTYSWNTSATTSVVAVSPSVTTSYTVTGTSNGCSNSATITQSVSACTGLNNNVASIIGTVVYPNPNTGLFTIELNNGSVKTIEVMDLTGRIVLTNTSSNDKIDFNISNLANGVYYVRVQSNNTVEVIKIVKQ
jgi:hypothetical protein